MSGRYVLFDGGEKRPWEKKEEIKNKDQIGHQLFMRGGVSMTAASQVILLSNTAE